MCDENIQIQSNVNTIPRKKYTNANQKNKYAYQNTPKHQSTKDINQNTKFTIQKAKEVNQNTIQSTKDIIQQSGR